MHECNKSDSANTRPYHAGNHECVSSSGQKFLPQSTCTRSKSSSCGRQAKGLRKLGNFNFHDLTPTMKAWVWAPFISANDSEGQGQALLQAKDRSLVPPHSIIAIIRTSHVRSAV